MKRTSRSQKVLAYLVVITAALVFVFPIAWLVLGSLKRPVDVLEISLPIPPTLTNYRAVLHTYPIVTFLRNSMIVAFGSTGIALVTGSFAAHGFARKQYAFVGSGLALLGILALRMLPGVALGIPLYLLFSRLGLIDSHFALILAHAAIQIPLVIWIMKGFFEEVPIEIEEASLVDGASRLRTLLRITLPLSAPGIAVTAILSFLFSWNDFGLALILSSSPDAQTMPVALSQMNMLYGIRWDLLSAAASMYIIPTLILALFLQRYIVRGLTMGSVKG